MALAQSLDLAVPHVPTCEMGMTFLPDFMRTEGLVRILGHKSNRCLVSTYGQHKAASDSTCVQREVLQVLFPESKL